MSATWAAGDIAPRKWKRKNRPRTNRRADHPFQHIGVAHKCEIAIAGDVAQGAALPKYRSPIQR